MNKHKRIFIVGHSGAGKGVLAEGVAKKLGWTYINADFSLTPSIGRPMDEIIGKQGEEAFYRCLSEILSYQKSIENIVVATDDSIVCIDKNRQLLSNEFVVNLKVSTAVQLERMSSNRPLLPMPNYREFLDKLHHDRDDLYSEVGSFTLNSDDNALDEHILAVVKEIGK